MPLRRQGSRGFGPGLYSVGPEGPLWPAAQNFADQIPPDAEESARSSAMLVISPFQCLIRLAQTIDVSGAENRPRCPTAATTSLFILTGRRLGIRGRRRLIALGGRTAEIAPAAYPLLTWNRRPPPSDAGPCSNPLKLL